MRPSPLSLVPPARDSATWIITGYLFLCRFARNRFLRLCLLIFFFLTLRPHGIRHTPVNDSVAYELNLTSSRRARVHLFDCGPSTAGHGTLYKTPSFSSLITSLYQKRDENGSCGTRIGGLGQISVIRICFVLRCLTLVIRNSILRTTARKMSWPLHVWTLLEKGI